MAVEMIYIATILNCHLSCCLPGSRQFSMVGAHGDKISIKLWCSYWLCIISQDLTIFRGHFGDRLETFKLSISICSTPTHNAATHGLLFVHSNANCGTFAFRLIQIRSRLLSAPQFSCPLGGICQTSNP